MADCLTKQQRSYCMSQIRSKNTSPEKRLFSALWAVRPGFKKHVKELPGKPDIVFKAKRVVVFVDGDFWHGWQLPRWEHRLGDYWKAKIRRNRARDRTNFAKLRRMGWKVVRVWEHEIEADITAAILRVETALDGTRGSRRKTTRE